MEVPESILDSILEKMNNIKNKIENMNHYMTNNNINTKYLEELSKFSIQLNSLEAMCEDMYDEYIVQSKTEILSNHDKLVQKNLIINKKVQDIFMPYMLYMNILLQNKQ
jgi:hypothetical protein